MIGGKDLDCVVLDLNLNGESGAPLADRFLALDVPIVLASGYGSGAVLDRLKSLPRIEKPFDPAKVVELVARLGTQVARY